MKYSSFLQFEDGADDTARPSLLPASRYAKSLGALISVKKLMTADLWSSVQASSNHLSLSSLPSGQMSLIFVLIQPTSSAYCSPPSAPLAPSIEPMLGAGTREVRRGGEGVAGGRALLSLSRPPLQLRSRLGPLTEARGTPGATTCDPLPLGLSLRTLLLFASAREAPQLEGSRWV